MDSQHFTAETYASDEQDLKALQQMLAQAETTPVCGQTHKPTGYLNMQCKTCGGDLVYDATADHGRGYAFCVCRKNSLNCFTFQWYSPSAH